MQMMACLHDFVELETFPQAVFNPRIFNITIVQSLAGPEKSQRKKEPAAHVSLYSADNVPIEAEPQTTTITTTTTTTTGNSDDLTSSSFLK